MIIRFTQITDKDPITYNLVFADVLNSSKEINDRFTTDDKDGDLVLDNELYFIKKAEEAKKILRRVGIPGYKKLYFK